MTATLSSIALDVVGEYRQTGKHLVRAYRGGSQRLVRGLHERGADLVGRKPVSLLGETAQTRLAGAQDKVAELVLRGVDGASERADKVIDGLADGAAAGIRRIGPATDRFEQSVDASGLKMVGALNRQAAIATLELAGRLSHLSQRLSDRLAGGKVATAKKAARTARKAVAKKVAKAAKAPAVQKTVRRARRVAAAATAE
jgi:hypothetical protein